MNVTSHVEAAALRTPEKLALLFEQQAYSYAELNMLGNRTANALAGLGVARGDRVALYIPNQPAFIIAYLGVLKLGAIAVLINTALKAEETQFILSDSTASILITTAELYKGLSSVETPHTKQVILVEGLTSGETLSLDALQAQASSDCATVKMNADDPAIILYTSGTTGFPKGAVISHGSVIASRQACVQALDYRADDRLLLCLPLFHSFSQRVSLHPCFEAGATLILQRHFEGAAVARTIQEEQVTRLAGVPSLYSMLYGQAEPAQLASVQRFISATAPLPLEVARKWRAKYGVAIEQTFGSAETGVLSHNDYAQGKTGSVGKALAGVELRIVSTDGQQVATDELGEIAVRGPSLMQSYWQRPEETAQAIREGWFHTGDIGRIDAEGYVYIVDRIKDMVNVGGHKVYPSEVEAVFSRHPAVQEVAVYGIGSATMGEQVCASVVLRAGQTVTGTDLMEFGRASLAEFKLPGFITFVDQFPKSSTGKVLKRVLREQTQGQLHDQTGSSIALDGLQEYILQRYLKNEPPEGFDPDYRLIDNGVLDSLAQADLIAYVENKYGIVFDLTDLVPEHFASIRALAQIINQKRRGVVAAGGQRAVSIPVVQRARPKASNGHPVTAKVAVPHELALVLNGPLGPQRLRDDTIVINGDGWYRLLTPSASWPAANEVFFSNLDAHDPDAGIDAIIAEYHSLGLSLTWCVYPWTQPGDLGERLLARGATQSAIQTFLGSTAPQIEVVADVDVEQIDPEATDSYEAYISAIAAGFGLPPDEEAFRRQRYRQLIAGPDPSLRLFLARYRGVVAGCCAAAIKEDSAHMTGVFVNPAFQARGVFQSLKAASLSFLREQGISIFTGHANKKSAFWVERFGAKPIFTYDIYQLDPPARLGGSKREFGGEG